MADFVIFNKARGGSEQGPRTQKQLEDELADARLLHQMSIELIQEDGTEGLYKKIVEAAVAIMRSQFGTMQMLYPDPGKIGKLQILASSGFTAEAEDFWRWVYSHTASSCGESLRKHQRVIVPEYATCDFMQGTTTLPVFLNGGILSAQSTPLYSRSGKLLGMISTHWDRPYTPPQRHLDLLDILARQAADLIERTQNAEALAESEQRIRALANATNDVIFKMSPDWTEMYRLEKNDSFVNTGKPERNALQTYILPEDQQALVMAAQDAIRTKGVFQLEHRVLKSNGMVGWMFTRAIPIINQEGEITEWFGAASDISEKKQLLTQLEKLVDERTQELQRSNEDLQQFAHVASHDLKEPVRKIRTFGLRLKHELSDILNEKSQLFTDKILESASRMSTMIDGVLTYSSLSAAEQKIELLDLNKIIFDIINDLEILVEEKNAVIQFDKFPQIEGVQVLIYQLFYNLINNSLKFSKSGVQPIVSIYSDLLPDGQLKVMIKDNGIGFAEEQRQNIFNPFTRLHSKSIFDGTGLGLSLSKKIVERHNGTITAESKMDEGAVFTIVLPLKQ